MAVCGYVIGGMRHSLLVGGVCYLSGEGVAVVGVGYCWGWLRALWFTGGTTCWWGWLLYWWRCYCAVGYGQCGLLAGLLIGGGGGGGTVLVASVTVRLVTGVVVYWRGCLLVGRVCTGGVVTVRLVTGVVLLFTDGVVYWLGGLPGWLCYWWSLLLVGVAIVPALCFNGVACYWWKLVVSVTGEVGYWQCFTGGDGCVGRITGRARVTGKPQNKAGQKQRKRNSPQYESELL